MDARTVITVDRSLLAANMYRLIFAPLGFGVSTLQSLDELVRTARRLKEVSLIVISTNAVGDRLDLLMRTIEEDPRLTRAPKLFLVGERARSRGLDAGYAAIPGGETIARPFHPDEFVAQVKRVLDMEKT